MVDAAALAEGYIQRVLQDPELLVLPRSQWPRKFKKARIRASGDEYYSIVVELLRRRILRTPEDLEAVVDAEGNRLGAGLFGVLKGQSVDVGNGLEAEVLRLIINLIPANEILEVLAGDIRTFALRWTVEQRQHGRRHGALVC